MGSPQTSQPAARSTSCQELWPLHTTLKDDLRCRASRAALPGSRWLSGLLWRAWAAWQQAEPAAIPGSEDIV